jgi:hypothetical protein
LPACRSLNKRQTQHTKSTEDSQLAKKEPERHESHGRLPLASTDHAELLRFFMPEEFTPKGHWKHFRGIPWLTLSRAMPEWVPLVKEEVDKKIKHLPVEIQHIVEVAQEGDSPRLPPTKHIARLPEVQSLLKIFYRFVALCEGLEWHLCELDMGMLIDPTRMAAFCTWMAYYYRSLCTVPNCCLYFQTTLHHVKAFMLGAGTEMTSYIRAKELFRQTGNTAKYKTHRHKSKIYN